MTSEISAHLHARILSQSYKVLSNNDMFCVFSVLLKLSLKSSNHRQAPHLFSSETTPNLNRISNNLCLIALPQVLSVIDTLLLMTAFPLYAVTNLLEYFELGDNDQTFRTKVYLLPLAFIAQTATIWVTVLVAFNRYIAVCQPFKAARLCTVVQVCRHVTIYLFIWLKAKWAL